MSDAWIPATSRLLASIARDGVSGASTFRRRSDAVAAAIALMKADPKGASMPVVIPLPLHRNGPEGLSPQLALQEDISFDYVNWRGERARRSARGPYAIRYGTSEYHATPQFLLSAVDLDRGQPREYALADMIPIL